MPSCAAFPWPRSFVSISAVVPHAGAVDEFISPPRWNSRRRGCWRNRTIFGLAPRPVCVCKQNGSFARLSGDMRAPVKAQRAHAAPCGHKIPAKRKCLPPPLVYRCHCASADNTRSYPLMPGSNEQKRQCHALATRALPSYRKTRKKTVTLF